MLFEKNPSTDLDTPGPGTVTLNGTADSRTHQDGEAGVFKNDDGGLSDRPFDDVQSRVSKPVWILIVSTMMASTFLFSLDNSIVAEIQPAIVESLGSVEKLGWLGVAFVLGQVSTIIFWGKVMGLFSVKWSYVLATVIFEVGSAVCGAASTMNIIIGGRALAGFGGAGMYVGCLSMLSMTTSLRERPVYMASTGFTWGAGTVLGPIVGGAFAQNIHTTWRWSFYINLCIGGLFAPAFLFLLPNSDPQKGVPFAARARRFDYVGTILNVGFLIPLVMAINFGGTIYAWNSGQEIALWVVTGVLFLAFCVQQKYVLFTTKENRLFPCDFLRMYDMYLLFNCMASAATCVFVPTYFIPLYFQFVRGNGALGAGVRLLPFICVMVFCGLLSGAFMTKSGYYMPWFLLGGCLTLTGGALMHSIGLETSSSRIYGYMAITGAGAGLYIQASYAVAQAKVAIDRVADAAGFISFAQCFGITLSLAISSVVFQNVAVTNLEPIFPNQPTTAIRDLIAGTSSVLLQALDAPQKESVLRVIVDAMDRTYILVITAGAVTAFCACLMKRERLFQS